MRMPISMIRECRGCRLLGIWMEAFGHVLYKMRGKPWAYWKRDGVWARDFKNGIVIMNPRKLP